MKNGKDGVGSQKFKLVRDLIDLLSNWKSLEISFNEFFDKFNYQ